MKFKLVLPVILTIVLLGCAGIDREIGRDFDSTKVDQIKKGETTADEVMKLFGEPLSRLVVSGTEEQWIYTYSRGPADKPKKLDITLIDGVVKDYVYSE
ncbi:MAG: outer membrane protein assembly factor BamE [Nitrospira sp.]|nr:outer membrane protein assembly factor BamE [Nitrospira sp.]